MKKSEPKSIHSKLIVFVCTGNTCRSPMAEGFAKSLSMGGLEFVSRGLCADGSGISENALLAMKENGIDMSGFMSQPLTEKDAKSAQIILTMTAQHKNAVLRLYEKTDGILGKTFTLREYAYGEAGDICDPFGLGMEDYRACAAEIKACVESALVKLQD